MFLVALATLLLEVALIRVLSFTIWYHFAYVVIATALLGYGAAGSLVSVCPRIGARDLSATLRQSSLLAAAASAGVLALIALLPLEPMEITQRPTQALLFLGYQLAVIVPFFFSGLVISLALRALPERVDRLYFWDLVGAGLGCALAIILMNALSPPGALLIASAGFAVAAAWFQPRRRLSPLVLTAALIASASWGPRIPFSPAPSKHLLPQLRFWEPTFTRWTALFRTDLLEDRGAGPRLGRDSEWGLSRRFPGQFTMPSRIINHDASAGTWVYDLRAGPTLAFLDYHIVSFPYLVTAPDPSVLVIGVGGGRDIIAGIQYGASHVTGVELDPVTIELIRDQLSAISNGFFGDEKISLVAGEGRHFAKTTNERFDLIQLTAVDTLSAEFSGAYVLAENYLYTVEAFHDFFDRLAPRGVLSFATGNLSADRPRAAARIVSVAQQALRERGVARPQDHIAVIDSQRLLVGILIRNAPFSEAEVRRLEDRTRELQFESLALPRRQGHPAFDALVSTTGREREKLLEELPYVVDATTDDRPFFFRFYRWRALLDAGQTGPVHTTALGQIVLMLLLITLSLLGFLLVMGPLLLFHRRDTVPRLGSVGVLLYFAGIGLGFMLLEISLIQEFVLFLGYPTYSLSVTLFSLLVFVGLGSFLSRSWVGREQFVLPLCILAIALLALFYSTGLPLIQEHLLGMSLFVRIISAVVTLAPLGIVLGAFFPLGIRRAAVLDRNLVPWAWGVNGCASVTATVLAVLVAMSHGFQRVWILSFVVYTVAVAALLLTTSGSGLQPAQRTAGAQPAP